MNRHVDVCMLIFVILSCCHSCEAVQPFVFESTNQGDDFFFCIYPIYFSDGLKDNLAVLVTAEWPLDKTITLRCQEGFPCYHRILFGTPGILWKLAFPFLVC